MKTSLKILLLPLLTIVLGLFSNPASAAALDPLLVGALERFPAQIARHPQVVLVCVTREWAGASYEWDREATVVQSLKGDWKVGDRLLYYIALEDKMLPTTKYRPEIGDLRYLFLDEYAKGKVLLQTGDAEPYRPEFAALAAKLGFTGETPDPQFDLNSLPDIGGGQFKTAPYLDAAVRLQAMGQQAACKVLAQAAQSHPDGQQVIVLCRVLFSKRDGADFRRPMIGGPQFFGGTGVSDWPLEPIELVDGVPFLITRGYMLAGVAESSLHYLGYCESNCVWSDFRYSSKTALQMKEALTKLLASPKWKKLPDAEEQKILATQIE